MQTNTRKKEYIDTIHEYAERVEVSRKDLHKLSCQTLYIFSCVAEQRKREGKSLIVNQEYFQKILNK